MAHPMSYSNGQLDKILTIEQFEYVVEAILDGKYSWACVLMLEAAGYNPLHYIPYRTYNRLIKDNRCQANCKKNKLEVVDLEHVNRLKQCDRAVKGGMGFYPSCLDSSPINNWD